MFDYGSKANPRTAGKDRHSGGVCWGPSSEGPRNWVCLILRSVISLPETTAQVAMWWPSQTPRSHRGAPFAHLLNVRVLGIGWGRPPRSPGFVPPPLANLLGNDLLRGSELLSSRGGSQAPGDSLGPGACRSRF